MTLTKSKAQIFLLLVIEILLFDLKKSLATNKKDETNEIDFLLTKDDSLILTNTTPNFTFSDEEPFWRNIVILSHQPEVIFSKDIEVKVDELPAWKPRVVIDTYRLEDDE